MRNSKFSSCSFVRNFGYLMNQDLKVLKEVQSVSFFCDMGELKDLGGAKLFFCLNTK